MSQPSSSTSSTSSSSYTTTTTGTSHTTTTTQRKSKIRKFQHTPINPSRFSTQSLLSPDVQASLLSVGMRIRKAIGTGYRSEWKGALGGDVFEDSRLASGGCSQGSGCSSSTMAGAGDELMMSLASEGRKRRLGEQDCDDDGEEGEKMDIEIERTCLRVIKQPTSRYSLGRRDEKLAMLEHRKPRVEPEDFAEAEFLDGRNRYGNSLSLD